MSIVSAPCPHPECRADIPVSKSLPIGEYDCLCKQCKVNLRWVSYMGGEKRPSLELVVKK